ncbi:cell envelope integrity protein TolA [Gilvimarinus sp. F26214L]|uniref:cell envelope integrity protein TolA n=1 Tax=Gilvimarinus sp. DZF01 TaxID=3461371 RepID=UPI004046100D
MRVSRTSSTSYAVPAVISVALHGVLLAFVIWGWEASSDEKRTTVPRYIEAKIVQMEAAAPKAAPPKPEPKTIDVAARREEAERQRREEEARRRAEQQRRQKAEEARKAKEREERLAREKAERERQAEEQRQAERQRMQEALENELEEERSLLQAQENAAIAQSYSALINDRVERNWSRPPSARNGMQAELSIQLVPTGRVVNVTVTKSSGNSAFDLSAERAVWKAEQFPELQQVPSTVFEEHFRQFTLRFNPQDLRQ